MSFISKMRTKYLDDQMIDGEYPLYRTHISWIPVLTREFPYWIAGGIIGGITWGITDNFLFGLIGLIVPMLIGFLIQIRLILNILSIDIVVTNKFVRYKEGIITIDENPTKPLYRIDSTDVDLDKNIWQRILKYGDFTLNSMSGEDSLYIKDVAKPRSLKRCIDIACNKYVYERGMNQQQMPMNMPGYANMPNAYGNMGPNQFAYGNQGMMPGQAASNQFGGTGGMQQQGANPYGNASGNGGYDWTRPGGYSR